MAECEQVSIVCRDVLSRMRQGDGELVVECGVGLIEGPNDHGSLPGVDFVVTTDDPAYLD